MRSEQGEGYAAGSNDDGELGHGHNNHVSAFAEVVGTGGWGKIVAVECGLEHTFMRSEHGKWYAAGGNHFGQLGLGHTNKVCAFTEVAGVWGKIVAVECGGEHKFMLSEHGKWYAAGWISYTQLGRQQTTNG